MPPLVSLVPGVTVPLLGAARCAVVASAIPALRPNLVATFPNMTPNTLKQCDEQTLTALTAVGQVLPRITAPATWDAWGVLVCPRRPGRNRLADNLAKFRTQGAWSTSPHIIPHTLLHSFSGLLSQALGCHGPNMGVGGFDGGEASVLRTVAAWLAGGDVVGAWLVWTQWDREGIADDATCEARVALVGGPEAAVTTGTDFWQAFAEASA